MSIGGTAKWSERKLCEYLPSDFCVIRDNLEVKSILSEAWKNGDLCNLDGSICIEVKSTKSEESLPKNFMMNQIRPMKYMVLVAVVHNMHKYGVDCIVYPPNYIIRKCLVRRGQATPDGIASVSFPPTLSEAEKFWCTFNEVYYKSF